MTNEQVITRIKHNSMYKDDRETADYIIKALEQQPSEDCVSRKELYNHCFDATIIGKSGKSITRGILLEDEIDGLQSVTPAQSWTPIELREPTQEEKEEYLTAHGEELCYIVESRMPEDGQEVFVSHGNCVTHDIFLEEFWNFENLDIENVEAWMPLPQPYEDKGGNKWYTDIYIN